MNKINHSIAHCSGINCSLKNNCLRYIAHKDAKNKKIKNILYIVSSRDGKECESYIDYKE